MKMHRKGMAGFSLLEALITALVLAIGLLGMAGLQGTALKRNHGSYLRSQAVVMAYDIMDRMRANRTAALAGSYDRDYGDSQPTQNCAAACNPVQMAASDEREWVDSLNRLPAGDGDITVNIATGVTTVTVYWDEERDNATVTAANSMKFTLATVL